MLNWIFSRHKNDEETSNHPLGTERGINTALAEITDPDPVRRIREINDWLDEGENLAQQLNPSQFANAMHRLEDFIQPDVAQCWRNLWEEAAKTQPGPLPTQLLEIHYRHAQKANTLVLQTCLADPQMRADKRILARHAIRAIRAWNICKKLARMVYRDPGVAQWKTALDLVILADEHQILNLPQPPYSHSPAQTTAWQEYVSGLLFEVAPLSSLTVTEMETIERLTRFIAEYVQHAEEPQPECLFYIDLENPKDPVRYRPGIAPTGERRRYFSLGSGYAMLIDLRESMNNDRKLPTWLESSACNLFQAKRLVNTLIQHWSATPPMRSQPRRKTNGEIFITHTLEVVRRMVSASEFAYSRRTLDYEGYLKSMTARHRGHEALVAEAPPPTRSSMETLEVLENEGARQMMEKWELIDMSAQGLGARLPLRKPWHTIGALVGYRFAEELDWRVGIIRRLGVSHGRPNAGLSVFPGIPQCSQLRSANPKEESPWANQTKETSGLDWRDAIVISEDPGLLVAPPGTFLEEGRLEVSIRGQFRPIDLLKLQAQGNGYELIEFRETRPT